MEMASANDERAKQNKIRASSSTATDDPLHQAIWRKSRAPTISICGTQSSGLLRSAHSISMPVHRSQQHHAETRQSSLLVYRTDPRQSVCAQPTMPRITRESQTSQAIHLTTYGSDEQKKSLTVCVSGDSVVSISEMLIREHALAASLDVMCAFCQSAVRKRTRSLLLSGAFIHAIHTTQPHQLSTLLLVDVFLLYVIVIRH